MPDPPSKTHYLYSCKLRFDRGLRTLLQLYEDAEASGFSGSVDLKASFQHGRLVKLRKSIEENIDLPDLPGNCN